jgi:hypothetical protein
MTVTVNQLKAHIERLDNGHLDFSQVELNTRADLVRFEGYSLKRACEIEESLAYDIVEHNPIMEREEFKNEYGLTCKCCGKPVSITYTDSPSDGYFLECKNEHYDFASIYGFDTE